jgi:peptide/nickel transport system substrate-binding protein
VRRASVVLALLLLGSCSVPQTAATPAPSAATSGGTLRIVVPAEITSLDPWSADAASLVATRQIYETLMSFDRSTGQLGPGLATAWQISSDGMSWTFTLHEGVRFQDGSALDAASVVASFQHGVGSAGYRLLFSDPSAIARVQAVDSRTVRFDLRAPSGPFLAHLAAPQAAIAKGQLGTGPFAASAGALAPDGSLTLTRSDSYWRRDGAGKALPYLDGLVLRPVRDPASRLAELRAGRAEVALDLPVPQAALARSDPSLVLIARRDAALASLGIDTTIAPFDRPDARRAMAMAVSPPLALDTTYAAFLRRTTQIVPVGTLGYDDSVVAFATLDVGAAKKLLADAHIPTPVNGDLAYPILPTAAYPDPQRMAQSIAADLASIGIVVRLRAIDAAALRDAKTTLTLDTTVTGLDPDDLFWPLLGSDDPANTTLAVGLLRKARTEPDPSKRAELYKQVSKIDRTDVLRIPLFFADRVSAASARLAGYAPATESFGTVWLKP